MSCTWHLRELHSGPFRLGRGSEEPKNVSRSGSSVRAFTITMCRPPVLHAASYLLRLACQPPVRMQSPDLSVGMCQRVLLEVDSLLLFDLHCIGWTGANGTLFVGRFMALFFNRFLV
jgi:hypothetical protein